jgi:hypothetical protein
MEAPGTTAKLSDHSSACGMISNDDAVKNSGEVAHGDMQNREIARSWDGGGEKGLHGGALGHLIGAAGCFRLLHAGNGRDPAAVLISLGARITSLQGQ